MGVEQIPLSLPAGSPFALEYFVPHSGVAESLEILDQALLRLVQRPEEFINIFLTGVSGVGKSHFLAMIREKASLLGIADSSLSIFEFEGIAADDDDTVSLLISTYEQRKAHGGIFLLASRLPAGEFTLNPHLGSRVKSAVILELLPPTIEELRPTLISLLERRNLRLSDRSIDYILKRVPTNPLSLWTILARIDDLALRQGRAVGLHFIREILGEI